MYPENDNQWEEMTIDRVEDDGEGKGWTIHFEEGFCFGVPADSQIVPEAGMKTRQYGRGFGFPVRGLFLDGVKVYYRTEAEEKQRHEEWCVEQRRKREAEFEKSRADMDAKYNALPDVFKKRLDGFRSHHEGDDFRIEHEPYEMFCIQEALKIVNTLKTVEKVKEFAEAEYEVQKTMVEMDDGHSGNTHGFSIRLAYLYLAHPELVTEEHGALCPLVGCEDYGCPPARKEPVAA